MANKALGPEFAICRDSGAFGSPAHIPLISAKNIKVSAKPAAVVDATDRVATLVDEKVLPLRANVEASFDCLWNGGAGITAVRNALIAGTAIRLSVIDNRPAASVTGGGVGYRGDWLVKKGTFKFGLREGQQWDFTICPHGSYTNAVVTYTDATTTLGTAETQANKKSGYAGSVNDSTNAPIGAIKEFSFDVEWDVADATDRGTASPNYFDMYQPVRRKISASMTFQWKSDDTQLTALRTAWLANSEVLLSLLDGPYATALSWGLGAAGGMSWAITDYPRDANLTDGQMVTLKLQPHGNGSVAPAFFTTS